MKLLLLLFLVGVVVAHEHNNGEAEEEKRAIADMVNPAMIAKAVSMGGGFLHGIFSNFKDKIRHSKAGKDLAEALETTKVGGTFWFGHAPICEGMCPQDGKWKWVQNAKKMKGKEKKKFGHSCFLGGVKAKCERLA